MRSFRRTIILSILSNFMLQWVGAAPLPRSVSPSQQFVIYGADATLRGAVSDLAEQTKVNLLALLRQPDRWKTAVILEISTVHWWSANCCAPFYWR